MRPMNEQDARRLLGVPLGPLADSEIKAAWKRAAFATHPDRGGSAHDFARVSDAAALLKRLCGISVQQRPISSPPAGASYGASRPSSSLQLGGPVQPGSALIRRREVDPFYFDEQAYLESIYGHLGSWGRGGGGYYARWVAQTRRRRKG